MLFIVSVQQLFLRNTRGDCGEVVSRSGQRASNYMDSCEEEECGGGIRGVIAHIPPRGMCLPSWQAEPSQDRKQAASNHRATFSASPAESHMWATHIEVLENLNIIAMRLQ